MTTVPGHLLDIAALADRTPTPDGRTLAVTTARTILLCLPREPKHVTDHRAAVAAAGMAPRPRKAAH